MYFLLIYEIKAGHNTGLHCQHDLQRNNQHGWIKNSLTLVRTHIVTYMYIPGRLKSSWSPCKLNYWFKFKSPIWQAYLVPRLHITCMISCVNWLAKRLYRMSENLATWLATWHNPHALPKLPRSCGQNQCPERSNEILFLNCVMQDIKYGSLHNCKQGNFKYIWEKGT